MVTAQATGPRRQGRAGSRSRRLHQVGEAPALDHHHGQGRQARRRDDRAVAAACSSPATPSSNAATRSTPTASAASNTSRPRASASSASACPVAKRARGTVRRSWSAAPKQQWKNAQPILEAISAKFNGEPCCAYLGEGGAGHFVKMIHNGIEYGDMQMIAEVYGVMRDGLGMDPADCVEGVQGLGQGPAQLLPHRDHRPRAGGRSSPRPASRWST